MANKTLMIILGILILAFIIIGGYFLFSGGDNDLCEKWIPDSKYDKVSFCTQGEAEAKATEIGCDGFHTHEQEGVTLFMSCTTHEDLDPIIESGDIVDDGAY